MKSTKTQNSRVNCNPSGELNRNLIVNSNSELNRNLIVNRDSDNKFLIIKPIDSYKPNLSNENKKSLSLLFNYKYEKDKKNDNNDKVVYVNFSNVDIKYSLPNTKEPESKRRHKSNTNKTKTKQKLVKEIIVDNSINSIIQSLCIKYKKDLFPYAGHNEIIELGYYGNPDWELDNEDNTTTKIVTIGILSLDGLKVIINNNIEDARYKKNIGKKQKIKLYTTLKQNITSIIKNTKKINEKMNIELTNKVSISDLANGNKLLGSFNELHKVNNYQHKYFESRQIFPPIVSYLLALCGFLDNILDVPQYNVVDTEFIDFTFDIEPEIEEDKNVLDKLTEIQRLEWYLLNFTIFKKKFNKINMTTIIDEEQEEIDNLIKRKLINTNSDYNNESVMFGYKPNTIDSLLDFEDNITLEEEQTFSFNEASMIDDIEFKHYESDIKYNITLEEKQKSEDCENYNNDIENCENIQNNNNNNIYSEHVDNKYSKFIDNNNIKSIEPINNTFEFGDINNYLLVKENTKKNKENTKKNKENTKKNKENTKKNKENTKKNKKRL